MATVSGDPIVQRDAVFLRFMHSTNSFANSMWGGVETRNLQVRFTDGTVTKDTAMESRTLLEISFSRAHGRANSLVFGKFVPI